MQVAILKSTHKILTDKVAALKKDIEKNSKHIGEMAALGDLRENSAYHAARETQVLLLEKMQRYQQYLRGRVVELSESGLDRAQFGACVIIKENGGAKTHTFNIVGPVEYELDLLPDMVTFAAPIAKLLIGKRVGDTVEANFGANQWVGEISQLKAIA